MSNANFLPSLGSGLIEQLQQIIAARLSSGLYPGSKLALGWYISKCTICEVPYGFHFAPGTGAPSFDTACGCAKTSLQPCTWADVAEFYLKHPEHRHWWAFQPPPMPVEMQAGVLLSRVGQCYAGYGAGVKYLNFMGKPMPTFEELPDKIQASWVASYCLSRLLSSVKSPSPTV